jgi:hypothetical protein
MAAELTAQVALAQKRPQKCWREPARAIRPYRLYLRALESMVELSPFNRTLGYGD